jgi:hypothetical protein
MEQEFFEAYSIASGITVWRPNKNFKFSNDNSAQSVDLPSSNFMSLTISWFKFTYFGSAPCLVNALEILPQVLVESDSHGPIVTSRYPPSSFTSFFQTPSAPLAI